MATNAELTAKVEELTKANADWEKAYKELEGQKGGGDELKALEDENKDLHAQIVSLEQERTAGAEQLDVLAKELEAAKKQIVDVDTLRTDLAAAREKIEQLEVDVANADRRKNVELEAARQDFDRQFKNERTARLDAERQAQSLSREVDALRAAGEGREYHPAGAVQNLKAPY